MKRTRIIFVVALALLIVAQAYATDYIFTGLDVASQKQVTVVRTDTPVDNPNFHFSQSANGFIDSTNLVWYENDLGNGQYEYWCEVPVSPNDQFRRTEVPPNDSNMVGIQVNDGDNPVGQAADLLVATLDERGNNIYAYPAMLDGSCTPIMPDTIRINSHFCAHICHGSYTIPIECESLEYTPAELLRRITIQNGCGDSTLCHSDNDCPRIDWSLFSWNLRVFPGCHLFLSLDYCGADGGCICISRSDDRLPVEMLGFDAQAGNASVTLNWATASEDANAGFIVRRSVRSDGPFDDVVSIPGAGTSSQRHNYTWTDNHVANGVTYYYTLDMLDVNNSRHAYEHTLTATPMNGAGVVKEFALNQNYPNPFNSQTSFTFSVPEAGHVSLKVFDLLGREVATVVSQDMAANTYTVNWSAKDLATGVYMYTLTSGKFSQTKKLLYLK